MGGARRKNRYTGCALENRAPLEGGHLRFTADAHTLRGEGEPTQKNRVSCSLLPLPFRSLTAGSCWKLAAFPVPDLVPGCWSGLVHIIRKGEGLTVSRNFQSIYLNLFLLMTTYCTYYDLDELKCFVFGPLSLSFCTLMHLYRYKDVELEIRSDIRDIRAPRYLIGPSLGSWGGAESLSFLLSNYVS